MKKTKINLIDLAAPRAPTIATRVLQRVVGGQKDPIWTTTTQPTAIDTIYSNGTHSADLKSDDAVY